jgi:hypothetical protein
MFLMLLRFASFDYWTITLRCCNCSPNGFSKRAVSNSSNLKDIFIISHFCMKEEQAEVTRFFIIKIRIDIDEKTYG